MTLRVHQGRGGRPLSPPVTASVWPVPAARPRSRARSRARPRELRDPVGRLSRSRRRPRSCRVAAAEPCSARRRSSSNWSTRARPSSRPARPRRAAPRRHSRPPPPPPRPARPPPPRLARLFELGGAPFGLAPSRLLLAPAGLLLGVRAVDFRLGLAGPAGEALGRGVLDDAEATGRRRGRAAVQLPARRSWWAR